MAKAGSRRAGRVRQSAAVDHRSVGTRPAADDQRDRRGGRSPTTARSTTFASCVPSSRAAATASRRRPTPRSSCTPTSNGAMRASSVSTACSPLPCATRGAGAAGRACCWRAIATASSRCITRHRPNASCLRRRSRPSWSIPNSATRVSYPALSEYFTFQNIFSDLTLFEGIKLLPPGHLLTIEPSGAVQTRSYWDYQFNVATRAELRRYRRGIARPGRERRAAAAGVGRAGGRLSERRHGFGLDRRGGHAQHSARADVHRRLRHVVGVRSRARFRRTRQERDAVERIQDRALRNRCCTPATWNT